MVTETKIQPGITVHISGEYDKIMKGLDKLRKLNLTVERVEEDEK